jgi:flagellar biosynthesis protein FliQ
MTSDSVAQIIREALMVAFWLSAPILIVGFLAGIVVSLVQIVTSIQDPAFNTVPRLAAVLVATILAMPWILNKATAYASAILGNLSRYAQ